MAEPSEPFTATPEGCRISIRVIPRARRSVLDGVRDGELIVRLAAPPVDGAANSALIHLLADRLDVPRSALTIAGGSRSRHKVVAVVGRRVADAAIRLGGAADYCTASNRGGTPSASRTKS